MFASWKGNRDSLANSTPQERLKSLCDELDINAPEGATVLDGILLRYVEAASEGDRSAMDFIYKELQHNGATQINVRREEVSADTQRILSMLGFADLSTGAIDADFSEVKEEIVLDWD